MCFFKEQLTTELVSFIIRSLMQRMHMYIQLTVLPLLSKCVLFQQEMSGLVWFYLFNERI